MIMEKSDVVKAFNKHFMELWDDIVLIFPDDQDMKAARLGIRGLMTVSSNSIYKVYKNYVYDHYRLKIEEGDLDYFLNKQYDHDLRNMDQSVLSKIDALRAPITKMGDGNKAKVIKYMQNLCALVTTAESLQQEDH